MKITLILIMFGVALDLSTKDFLRVIHQPKGPLIGLFSQIILLPALTFLFVLILKPRDSFALGMFLVAACPGGNISNFISSLAKANVALSVSITAVSTALSIFLTPFNFTFWSSLYFTTTEVTSVQVDFWGMAVDILFILTIPLIAGMFVGHKFPSITRKLKKPIRSLSILVFAAFVVIAFYRNFEYFLEYIHHIFLIVLVHNALALTGGYIMGYLGKLPYKDIRSISIETGIQNSGLALILIFDPQYFNGLGGMSLIAAFWGIWHIIAGMTLATFWSKRGTD